MVGKNGRSPLSARFRWLAPTASARWSSPSSGGLAVWFTGLPGAGKTTIATGLALELTRRGRLVDHLDGDVIRAHISSDLGFSRANRDTNVARIAWVSSRLVRAGVTVIVSAVSPFRESRLAARALVEQFGSFVEVHVATPLDECIRRDPKGLYAKALAGQLREFTGVSSPYETPEIPEIRVETTRSSVAESVSAVVAGLEHNGYLPLPALVSSSVTVGSGAKCDRFRSSSASGSTTRHGG